jgi:hypothetical protein
MYRLTKDQALDLLPAVVDGEATEQERIAFMSYIENDDEVKAEFSEALLIKNLLAKRLPRVKAPEHLKSNIDQLLKEKKAKQDFRDIPTVEGIGVSDEQNRVERPSLHLWKPALRYISAAAILLFITLTTIEFLDRMESQPSTATFVLESYTAQHFVNSGGEFLEPHFATNSTTEAEQYLLDHYGINMTIPAITGAQFAGLLIADFFEGFETPLLEYVQEEIGETIYLFAFEIDKIENHKYLKRNPEAVKSCVTNTDFFVAEINDHHVVSWKWDGNWYSAVSNHNGYDLASLIEPLNFSR